jgi:ABC-type lipoprotein export system ATPase subunit
MVKIGMEQLFSLQNIKLKRHLASGGDYCLTIDNFSIPAGKVVAIVGKSGAGKSTFLNLLGGLQKIDSGSATLHFPDGAGHILGTGEYPFAHVGWVFQQDNLVPNATVAVNLALACQARGIHYTEGSLVHALESAGLKSSFLHRRAWELSGGERQRVAIARALIGNPLLILADEPTSSADPGLAIDLIQALAKISSKSLLWVTHQYELAVSYADVVVVLTYHDSLEGRLAGIINGEQVPRAKPASPETLLEWVESSYALGTSPETNENIKPSSFLDPPPHTPLRSSRLARLIAVSDLWARPNPSRDFDKLIPLTSITDNHHGFGKDIFLNARSFVTSFAHGSLWLRQTLAMLVVAGLLGGWISLSQYFKNSVSDPKQCHISISGTPRTTKTLTPNVVEHLAARPWITSSRSDNPGTESEAQQRLFEKMDGVPENTGCDVSNAAWPRMTDNLEIALPDEEGNCPDKKNHSRVQALLLHRHEPVLQSIPLISQQGKSAGSAMRNQPGAGRELGIVITETFAGEALKRTVSELQQVDQLCLLVRDEQKRASLLGVAKNLPADHRGYYEALLPLSVFEISVSVEERNTAGYETAAIYFETDEIGALSQYISPPIEAGRDHSVRYRFDPDILSKLRETLTLSGFLFSAIIVFFVCVIVITFMNIFASYLNLIRENSKAFTMQIILGLPTSFIRSTLMWHMTILTALSTAALSPVLFSIHLLLSRKLGVASNAWLAWGVALTPPFAIWGVSAVAIAYSVRSWRNKKLGRMAEGLQGGF